MYDIFISYANEDKQLSIDLENRLKLSGFIVYRDKSTLKAGDDWRDKVFEKIRTCDLVILLWSIHSSKSRPTMEEVLESLKYDRRILPCMLDETRPLALLEGKHYFKLSNLEIQYDELLSNLNLEHSQLSQSFSQDVRYAINTYKAVVTKQYSTIQVLFEGKNETISQAYVDLNLCVGIDSSNKIGGQAPKQLFDKLQDRNESVVLVGYPGTGKTSTLRYLMYLWSQSKSNTIAAFVKLKDFEPRFHSSFDDFILEQFYEAQNIQSRNIYEKSDVLNGFKWVLLLDGLDEVPAGLYSTLIKHLKEFSITHRSFSFIITTRIDGFRDEREQDFLDWKFYSIAPLDDERIDKFIMMWFENKDLRIKLVKKLHEKPRLLELAKRAFLLALICLVFEEDGEVGQNRSALYERATHYLEKSRLKGQLSKNLSLRRDALQEIALWYLRLNSTGINHKILLSIIDNLISAKTNIPAKEFLQELVNSTGLLQNYGGAYTFTHKSFQEYYSALGLKKLHFGEDLILDYCHVSHWEEPIRLFAGSIESTVQQENFLNALWKKHPALALRTATECHSLASSFLHNLLDGTKASDRIRMINDVAYSLRTLDKVDAQRLAIETLEPLFKIENDSSVLYFGIQLLEEFDPSDQGNIMHRTFFMKSSEILKNLICNSKYKFNLLDIPHGTFLMGDDASQDKIERPAHKVMISEFRINKYQITNLAYEKVMGTSKREEGVSELDDEPVININWYDAYIFSLKIGCRLPTEAEWEYAARAGTNSNWCFGDEVSELYKYANYEDSEFKRTWSVGTGNANAWGIHDVHGNVWEWCQDWLAPYSGGTIQVNPKGPASGTKRVRRGGGHAYHARGCRSAFRWGNDPLYSFKDIGFRVVQDKCSSQ